MQSLETEVLLTAGQVAKMLQVSVDWVQAHCGRRAPHLPFIRVGKLLRFRRTDVDRFIDLQSANNVEAALAW